MTAAVLPKHGDPPRTPRRPRLIAVIPAYNEEATVIDVLERLEPQVDEIVIVDDGSTDRTKERIFVWSDGKPNVHPLFFNRNRGMSAAYYSAFEEIGARVAHGDLSEDDVVLTIDADGQHEPEVIDSLVRKLVDGPYDAVIARRNLSTYPRYKRLGNWLMSTWASMWAGCRLFDVESGFRVFRVGALLAALRYYRGYRYSETVEVAMILPRLGYRVCNDVLVPVPVFRSNTRIKDFLIDALAMPAAWWRVIAGRDQPSDVPSWTRYALPALGPFFLFLMVLDLLIHPLFLGDDSVHNYAHVWYISEQLFQHGHIPMHIRLLDGGRAVTFPYGFVPYLVGALLFRLFDNFSVTLLMAIGVAGMIWTAGLVRPSMRNPWFILLAVLNPFFIDAVYAFQFASVWCVVFFFLFVYFFERRRYILGAGALWLTVSTHPILGAMAAGTYGAWLLVFDRKQARALILLSMPVAVAVVPFYWMALKTPSVHENALQTIVSSVADVVPRRGTLFAMPFAVACLAPYMRANYRLSLAAVVLAAAGGVFISTDSLFVHHGGYYGAIHGSSDVYQQFFASPSFHSGATYRVLEPNEREDGMYRFIRNGAVLSNEFFSESIFRRSFTEPQYNCFVSFRTVDYVVYERMYQHQFHRNEQTLLNSLVSQGRVAVTYADPQGRFMVYDVRNFAREQPKPASLSSCGLY
jgi:UDP-N-acetylglucosamine---dolichyl-phosphate N-acetylglucosaminyltransferase